MNLNNITGVENHTGYNEHIIHVIKILFKKLDTYFCLSVTNPLEMEEVIS